MTAAASWAIKVATVSPITGRQGWQLVRRGTGHPVMTWPSRSEAEAEARRLYNYDEGQSLVSVNRWRP